MEKLPVEIFGHILTHLTLTDWKCLRLTSRTIYLRLSSFSSYSHIRPIVLSPKSSSGITILENVTSIQGIDHLSLSNFNYNELNILIQKSESFRLCLYQLTSLSFSHSTTLIDIRIFYDLLSYCKSLEKLDLSYCKYFFLSQNFSENTKIFSSIKQLNLNGNTHLSDYAFNRLIISFPNLETLHLLDIPLRSFLNSNENRTFLTFENICTYFQNYQERFRSLSISFDPSLSCDTQIKRLFITIPPKLTYFHIDGTLTVSTLIHFLLLFDNHLETLIVGRLQLDHTGCQPLFTAINEYASNFKTIMCIFKYTNETFSLPRNTTDDVIKHICIQSSFSSFLTHLNLSNCLSLSNRSILLINKYLYSLEELIMNYNININDFAFIGLSICGIGKTIEWIDQTILNRQFIDDLPIWTYTITHQTSCKCQLPMYISSSCIKLRLKDFNFDYDDYSDRILFMLTEHKLFNEYFSSINELKNLKTLKLRQCIQLTNRLFRFGIRSLLNLKYLDISLCEKINDKNLSLIGQACPSIEIIDLSGCHKITDNGKQILKRMLKELKLLIFKSFLFF